MNFGLILSTEMFKRNEDCITDITSLYFHNQKKHILQWHVEEELVLVEQELEEGE